MKKIIIGALFILLVQLEPTVALAEAPLKVVATLSAYADIAKSVGRELVDVSYIVSPKFDPHFIEPKPSDVLKLKRADLFIHSGLDLEAWRQPLVDAAARAELRPGGDRQLDLSAGISLLNVPTSPVSRAEGDIHLFGNPHYWVDPRNGLIIAGEIAVKLAEIDPVHAADYNANEEKFLKTLREKIGHWQEEFEPFKGTRVVGYHDSWPYLMSFTGLVMDTFMEPKPGIPPTPKQIQSVISYVQTNRVPVLIQEPFYSDDAARQIAAATGAKIIILVQSVGATDAAKDYISMVEYNLGQLRGALQK